MSFISIFNDVLGPVMRGPSSSHTAGGYRIARLVRHMLGEEPVSVRCTFDPAGSYAPTYKALAVDLAMAAGFIGWPLEDGRFSRSLLEAGHLGLDIRFVIAPLEKADHPNAVKVEAAAKLYKRAQEIVAAEVPWVNIAHSTVFEPIRNRQYGRYSHRNQRR